MKKDPEIVAGDGAALAIYRDGPSLDGARTAVLGGFTCDDAEAGAALIAEVMGRLRGEGFGAVLGPMDGSTWAKYRLVVESDGSAPFLMEPSNPAWYPAAFEGAGMEIVSRYVSSSRPADIGGKEPVAPEGVRLRAFEPEKAVEALGAIHDLSLRTFANNAFYTPISREEFVGAYAPVIGMLDPELVLLAEDDGGRLAGFLFSLPNFAEGERPASVILKTYASSMRGVGSFLADTFHERVRQKDYQRVIHALMHVDNVSAAHSTKTGGEVFRRYALWGARL